MNDSQHSTSTPAPPAPTDPTAAPAANPEDWMAFRESFLVYFCETARENLRAAARDSFDLVLERGAPALREPWTHARLRALARDLAFIAQLLEEIGREPAHGDPVHPDEARLQAEAPTWAAAARRLQTLIDTSLEHPEPPS